MAQQGEYIGEKGGLAYWQAHIHALAMSGLSRAEYCRRHKIAASSLRYWQKKLLLPQENQAQLVAVSMPVGDYVLTDNRSFALHLVLPGNRKRQVNRLPHTHPNSCAWVRFQGSSAW